MKRQTIEELKSIKVDLLTKIEAINLILELFESKEDKSTNIDLSVLPKIVKINKTKVNNSSKNWKYNNINWYNEVLSILETNDKSLMLKDIVAYFPTITSGEKKKVVNNVGNALFRLVSKGVAKKEKATSEYDKAYYLYSYNSPL